MASPRLLRLWQRNPRSKLNSTSVISPSPPKPVTSPRLPRLRQWNPRSKLEITQYSWNEVGNRITHSILHNVRSTSDDNSNSQSRNSVKCVCVCFIPIHSGHQVRWTYQPGSHRRKVTQDFHSPSFCGACLDFSRRKDSAIPFPRRP